MITKTTEQLKSIAYDLMLNREQVTIQLQQINQEIGKREIEEQKKSTTQAKPKKD